MNCEARKEAEALLGRELEVEMTDDGKHIVLFMNFELPPPPKADTPEGAYKAFSDWYRGLPDEKKAPPDLPPVS